MTDILVPAEQEGTKAIVRSWLKQVGDTVFVNDPLVELETDKVTQEVSAPVTGTLESIFLHTDAEALPGAVLGRIRVSDGLDVASEPATPDPLVRASLDTALSTAQGPLSPAVRRALRQTGIDPATIAGTGRGGRITRADVDQAAAVVDAPTIPVDAAARLPGADSLPAPTASAVSSATGNMRSVPHDRMRLAIAQNMLNSVTKAPHVTAMFEADFSAIIAHRRKHKPAFERDGVNLTFTAYLIAASAVAMQTVPAINSRWYDDRLDIYDDINIGIGTALGEKGLIVPVVHRAQELSLFGIAKRLGELIGRARDNSLSGGDVRGGTFTISNHGVSGSLFASPIIINQPQSAILGVGKTEKRVVVREVGGSDAIQIRPMAYVSLTIDHRVIDGHQTNSWLSKFVETIEAWPL
jgi:2-oxoglutarate dehydrogenase E2 component (dihydrolipoamide succinyltransferase)